MIFLRYASQALGQSYAYSSVSEVIMQDKDKIGAYLASTKHNQAQPGT